MFADTRFERRKPRGRWRDVARRRKKRADRRRRYIYDLSTSFGTFLRVYHRGRRSLNLQHTHPFVICHRRQLRVFNLPLDARALYMRTFYFSSGISHSTHSVYTHIYIYMYCTSLCVCVCSNIVRVLQQ